MKIEKLDDETYLLFAAGHYYNPRCSEVEDFYEDLHRIKYIKRLINRYLEAGKLSERLLLNHIIVFGNSFSIPATLKIFEFKIESEMWPVLKPFLVFLNFINESDYPEINSDPKVQDLLGKI